MARLLHSGREEVANHGRCPTMMRRFRARESMTLTLRRSCKKPNPEEVLVREMMTTSASRPWRREEGRRSGGESFYESFMAWDQQG